MAAHAGANNIHTRKIAEFVSGLTYEQIPAEVRERIKLLILDSLGCAIYGANLEWCRILRDTLEALDATRTTSIWGTDRKLSSPHAALRQRHPGAGLRARRRAPPGRAARRRGDAAGADRRCRKPRAGMSGRDFLTAAVAGYEIGPRVGLCMGQEHIGQGWHSGATVGVFSAAAGAARGLEARRRQDRARARHRRHPGVRPDGGAVRRDGQAHACRPRRRRAGFTARCSPKTASPASSTCSRAHYGGFCTTFSRSTDRFNLEELSAGLGERLADHGHFAQVLFLRRQQPHHARRHPRHAASAGRSRRRRRRDRRARLAGHGRPRRLDVRPQGLTSAQLNLPYCVATLLIEGDCSSTSSPTTGSTTRRA